jgi:hypothetical protein
MATPVPPISTSPNQKLLCFHSKSSPGGLAVSSFHFLLRAEAAKKK